MDRSHIRLSLSGAVTLFAGGPPAPGSRPLLKDPEGIAGDLFVMVFPMLDFPVREVIRISGPFDAYVQQSTGGR